MVANQIEREIKIEAPVERVWTTLTSAEHLGIWFADSGAEIDLKPGGSLVLNWKDYGKVIGRVEKVESPHTFSYRWANGPSHQEITATNSTLVEFSLSPEGTGTRLRVVESGIALLEGSDDERNKFYEDHSGGWVNELNELRDHTLKVAV
jgi:uncharacterized protein YndB with AHSA1/START domain